MHVLIYCFSFCFKGGPGLTLGVHAPGQEVDLDTVKDIQIAARVLITSDTGGMSQTQTQITVTNTGET